MNGIRCCGVSVTFLVFLCSIQASAVAQTTTVAPAKEPSPKTWVDSVGEGLDSLGTGLGRGEDAVAIPDAVGRIINVANRASENENLARDLSDFFKANRIAEKISDRAGGQWGKYLGRAAELVDWTKIAVEVGSTFDKQGANEAFNKAVREALLKLTGECVVGTAGQYLGGGVGSLAGPFGTVVGGVGGRLAADYAWDEWGKEEFGALYDSFLAPMMLDFGSSTLHLPTGDGATTQGGTNGTSSSGSNVQPNSVSGGQSEQKGDSSSDDIKPIPPGNTKTGKPGVPE